MKKKQTIILRDDAMRDRFIKFLSGLNLEKPWQITWGHYVKPRSNNQLRLMWMWLEEVVHHIHEDTGQDKEDIHEYLKRRFLTPKVKEVFGVIVKTWSTKDLSTAEMSVYLDKIYAWATSEMGLLLPVPEDLGRAA